MATLFLLLTVLSARRVWLSLLMAVCCVLAKETFAMVLLIPLVVGSWDRVNRVLWGFWAFLAAPLVFYGVVAFGTSPELQRVCALLTQLSSLLTLWVVPVGLTIEHDWALITPIVMALATSAWVIAGLMAASLSITRGALPAWSIGLLLILAFFAPRMFVPMNEGLHEHHLYAVSPLLSLYVGSFLKG